MASIFGFQIRPVRDQKNWDFVEIIAAIGGKHFWKPYKVGPYQLQVEAHNSVEIGAITITLVTHFV